MADREHEDAIPSNINHRERSNVTHPKAHITNCGLGEANGVPERIPLRGELS